MVINISSPVMTLAAAGERITQPLRNRLSQRSAALVSGLNSDFVAEKRM